MKKLFPLQEKIEALEQIEAYFERSDINLEEAIEKHKEALTLAKEIIEYLKTAEQSLEEVDITTLRKGL